MFRLGGCCVALMAAHPVAWIPRNIANSVTASRGQQNIDEIAT
jgi:hypothetical protein